MQNRRRGSGIIAFAMILLFMTGLVFGMVIIHIIDKQHEEEVIQELTPIEEIIEETVNVYFPARHIEYGQIPIHSYNPEGFRDEDGYVAYYNEAGEKISHIGADLSYHNEKINWSELAGSPVEFVMLRCGYRGTTQGAIKEDSKFRQYAKGACDAGLEVGAYFYSQAINEEEAIEEADFVINILKDYDITYPVAFDTEYSEGEDNRFNQADVSREELTNICIAFCERIREAGYYPMIYASENWFRRRLDVTRLTDYDFWAPQYNEENDFLYDFTIWQYTDSGELPGIDGPCDIDVSFIDYSEYVPSVMEAHETDGEVSEYNPNNPNITITPET